MRKRRFDRILLALMLGVAAGLLVAYANPRPRIDRAAEQDIALIERIGHDMRNLLDLS